MDKKYGKENMELISQNGKIVLIYDAKAANIVASSENKSHLEVTIDNKQYKTLDVLTSDFYNVATAKDYGLHQLEINITNPGFKIFTFTFG